jgi:activator of HSP90 ATPase
VPDRRTDGLKLQRLADRVPWDRQTRMADVVSFPAGRRSSCTISPYRAYRFAPDGSVRSTAVIEASTDAEAAERALHLSDRDRVELWSRARFVAHVGPMDGPVVASITLLEDPQPTTDP